MDPEAALRRPNYFNGQQLATADFDAERDHLEALRKLYNIGLYEPGIAAGLTVSAGADDRSVAIAPGLAVQPSGQEVLLGTAMSLQVPAQGNIRVNLFIVAEPQYSDPSQTSLALGYKRVVRAARPFFADSGATVDDEAVFLAAVALAADGTVAAIEGEARRPCGLALGRLGMLRADNGAVAATLGMESDGDAAELLIRAPAMTLTGGLGIAGGLAIGSQSPRAGLDVESKRPLLLSVVGESGQSFLAIDQAGKVAIAGAVASPSARLAVGGDVALDSGQSVLFDSTTGTGSLASGAAGSPIEHGVALGGIGTTALAGTLAVTSLGTITLCSGAIASPLAPTLTIDAAGQVAIGFTPSTTEPLDQALVVDGSVQSLKGGFEFADGVIQATAAISTTVQIGGIVEWWSGNGKISKPTNYAVCDGSIVTDPASPLHGKALPNLVGSYVCGTTDYGGIGVAGGAPTHVHAIEQLAAHTHNINHAHSPIGQSTSSDQTPGDSDTTDSKCSNTDHTHGITVAVPSCPESDSLPNDTGIAGFTTQDAPSLPVSLGLVMLMRIL